MHDNAFLFISLALDALRDPFAFAFLMTAGVLAIGFYNRRRGVAFFLSIGGTFLITHILKSVFRIPRPDNAFLETTGYRFPSLHAAIAGAFFASLWLYAWTRWPTVPARTLTTLCAVAAILGVSWSRIYLGVHVPLDVFVGALVGIGMSFAVHALIRMSSSTDTA